VLSHGRLDVGVGRGLYKYDYDISNVPMSESRERFDENLAIIRALWTDEHVTYRGRWTTVEGHTLGPKPLQRPCPPIWVAAVRTEDTYSWAGAQGFDLLTAPFFFPDHADQQRLLSVYRDALLAHGHDPAAKEVMAVYHMYCGESEADIAAVADPALGRYQAFTKATDLSRQAYRDPVAYKDWKGFFENRETITLEQMKASRAVIGGADECIEKVAMLSERFGVTYLCFEVNFGALPHAKVMESMERFTAAVMRRFS
ncbi:MAG TPA: LLM class flavin-dependent oxidoreductase, partial [Acetobacteraceae bacterium]|nr:LLM class flavin-dependent oxidoreductase [Acetobacteraceae bacterium]